MSDPFDEFPNWPRAGDRLFGFEGNRHLQVFIAESTDFYAHVEGYKRAGDSLIEELRKEPRVLGINYLVFPVVFLYRHFVELSIKDVIAHGNYLSTMRSEFPTNHDLLPLWTEARKVLAPFGGCRTEDLDAVESIIAELDRIDPKSFSFRYPAKKDWTPSLPQTEFNLEQFALGIAKLAEFFDAARGILSHYKDQHDSMIDWESARC
jgi:hypothetical protein